MQVLLGVVVGAGLLVARAVSCRVTAICRGGPGADAVHVSGRAGGHGGRNLRGRFAFIRHLCCLGSSRQRRQPETGRCPHRPPGSCVTTLRSRPGAWSPGLPHIGARAVPRAAGCLRGKCLRRGGPL